MKVLFFAQSRVAAGCDHCFMQSQKPLTESEFWAALIRARPELEPLAKTARLARHDSYLQAGDLIHGDDEIAVIPPVSGG